jgi:hypothetical protein
MKSLRCLLAIPAAIALSLGATEFASAQTVQLAPGFNPNPKVFTGTSGGRTSSSCGNLPANPSQTVTLTQAMNLVFSVQGANSLTMMIKSPDGGTFCVISDGSGAPLQQPGYWNAGTYAIYIGDQASSGNAYQLSIAQN